MTVLAQATHTAQNSINANHVVVTAATAAAEIYNAGKIAKQLSLVAKNARTVVLRAGGAALGFKVVSDFFVELSTNAIVLVTQVNVVAIELSRGAISGWRANELNRHLHAALVLSGEGGDHEAIARAVSKAERETCVLIAQLKQQTTKLTGLVNDIQQQMRSGKVISIISRIEASRAGEFRQVLEELADKVEVLAEQMISHIKAAIKQLDSAK